MVALVLTVWAALMATTAGVFVALIRGGGGTDAAAGEAGPVAQPELVAPLPDQRDGSEAADVSHGLPAQRLGAESLTRDGVG